MKKINDKIWTGKYFKCINCNSNVFVPHQFLTNAKTHEPFLERCHGHTAHQLPLETNWAANAFVCPNCNQYQERAFPPIKINHRLITNSSGEMCTVQEINYNDDIDDYQCVNCGKEYKKCATLNPNLTVTLELL